MIRELLRGLGEWMARWVGRVVLILIGGLLLLPLMWREHHHRGVFWIMVSVNVWLSILFIWRLASGPGKQTCPQCEKVLGD
jgi:hypothetical protein